MRDLFIYAGLALFLGFILGIKAMLDVQNDKLKVLGVLEADGVVYVCEPRK